MKKSALMLAAVLSLVIVPTLAEAGKRGGFSSSRSYKSKSYSSSNKSSRSYNSNKSNKSTQDYKAQRAKETKARQEAERKRIQQKEAKAKQKREAAEKKKLEKQKQKEAKAKQKAERKQQKQERRAQHTSYAREYAGGGFWSNPLTWVVGYMLFFGNDNDSQAQPVVQEQVKEEPVSAKCKDAWGDMVPCEEIN